MIGKDIYNFAQKLWPIDRSITGEGVRQTLYEIKKLLPNLQIHSVASNTKSLIGLYPKNG